jgi:uncharacterized protein
MHCASVAAACLLLAGCGTWSASFRDVEQQLAQEKYREALQILERQGASGRDRVLHLLNKGMVQRMAGDYQASNQTFETAKQVMGELEAASVSESTAMLIINDAAHSYLGEEHEQVLVHLYQALNYIELGDLDNARVEALQTDLLLRRQAERLPAGHTEDAFARYLTGMIYEDLGEYGDALIAYRKSYEAYEQYGKLYGVSVPQPLKLDLLRLTSHLGLKNETAGLRKQLRIEEWPGFNEWRDRGELVFVLHNGLAPVKQEHSATALDPTMGHILRISLPYYTPRPALVASAKVHADKYEARAEVVEDVQAIAQRSLDAKMAAITARAVARVIAKRAAVRTAQSAAGKSDRNSSGVASAAIAIGAELAALLTERADTRSWATLPQNILLARLPLPPGTYKVKIELLGAADQRVGELQLPALTIRPGRKTYVSRHWTASVPATPRSK